MSVSSSRSNPAGNPSYSSDSRTSVTSSSHGDRGGPGDDRSMSSETSGQEGQYQQLRHTTVWILGTAGLYRECI